MTYGDGVITEWAPGGQIFILVSEGNEVLPMNSLMRGKP
ncbi:hypothetical protein Y017_05485 [Alcanivorax sp. 97CO-5]|nr:hypothetical protein Y017_05485 [Alcanivorax sp. 97CO-5]